MNANYRYLPNNLDMLCNFYVSAERQIWIINFIIVLTIVPVMLSVQMKPSRINQEVTNDTEDWIRYLFRLYCCIVLFMWMAYIVFLIYCFSKTNGIRNFLFFEIRKIYVLPLVMGLGCLMEIYKLFNTFDKLVEIYLFNTEYNVNNPDLSQQYSTHELFRSGFRPNIYIEQIYKNRLWILLISAALFVGTLYFLYYFVNANEIKSSKWRFIYDKNSGEVTIKANDRGGFSINNLVMYYFSSDNDVEFFSPFIDSVSGRFAGLFDLDHCKDLILNEKSLSDISLNVFGWNYKLSMMNKGEIISRMKQIKEGLAPLNKIFNKKYNQRICDTMGNPMCLCLPKFDIYKYLSEAYRLGFINRVFDLKGFDFTKPNSHFLRWNIPQDSFDEYMEVLIHKLENDQLTCGEFKAFVKMTNRLLDDMKSYLFVATEEERVLIGKDLVDEGINTLVEFIWRLGEITWHVDKNKVKFIE